MMGEKTRVFVAGLAGVVVGSIGVAGAFNPFTDVPPDAFYADAVDWAYNEELTTGTSSSTFSPNEAVTRGQMVVFLQRLVETYELDEIAIRQADSDFYQDRIREEIGIENGLLDSYSAIDEIHEQLDEVADCLADLENELSHVGSPDGFIFDCVIATNWFPSQGIGD